MHLGFDAALSFKVQTWMGIFFFCVSNDSKMARPSSSKSVDAALPTAVWVFLCARSLLVGTFDNTSQRALPGEVRLNLLRFPRLSLSHPPSLSLSRSSPFNFLTRAACKFDSGSPQTQSRRSPRLSLATLISNRACTGKRRQFHSDIIS